MKTVKKIVSLAFITFKINVTGELPFRCATICEVMGRINIPTSIC